jgi:hypothetical protein
MEKQFLLGANKEIDKHKQVVEIDQVIQFEGGNYDKFVVYNIIPNDWGIAYKLINIRTLEFHTTDIIQPLSEKFGIGFYFDDVTPSFMDCFEVQILLQGANDRHKFGASQTPNHAL